MRICCHFCQNTKFMKAYDQYGTYGCANDECINPKIEVIQSYLSIYTIKSIVIDNLLIPVRLRFVMKELNTNSIAQGLDTIYDISHCKIIHPDYTEIRPIETIQNSQQIQDALKSPLTYQSIDKLFDIVARTLKLRIFS